MMLFPDTHNLNNSENCLTNIIKLPSSSLSLFLSRSLSGRVNTKGEEALFSVTPRVRDT